MKIIPPNDKLLVEIISEEVKTESGIVLSIITTTDEEAHPHSIHLAKVIAAGRESKYIAKGDHILLEHCFTRPFVFRGDNYKIIKESDIVGRLNGTIREREGISPDAGSKNKTIGTESTGIE